MNASHPAGRPPQFRLGRVLLVLVPLSVVVTASLLGWGYYDVPRLIARWLLPPLVPATGRVYLNGETAGGAQVFTEPIGLHCRGGMAVADREGWFSLRTDVDGNFLPGVYLGEHRVIIRQPDPHSKPGPFKPPLISPPECAEFETTPLRMRVDRDPARNQVEFRLEHKAEAPPANEGQEGEEAPRPDGEPLGAGESPGSTRKE